MSSNKRKAYGSEDESKKYSVQVCLYNTYTTTCGNKKESDSASYGSVSSNNANNQVIVCHTDKKDKRLCTRIYDDKAMEVEAMEVEGGGKHNKSLKKKKRRTKLKNKNKKTKRKTKHISKRSKKQKKKNSLKKHKRTRKRKAVQFKNRRS